MVIKESKGDLLHEGEWRMGLIHGRMPLAIVRCPSCGHRFPIVHHKIAADGTVTPELMCPSCNFKDKVTLEGWFEAVAAVEAAHGGK